MRKGLTLKDLPPRGYHSSGYWAVALTHDFYASGDEVWEVTQADLPDGSIMDKLRPALANAMTRHGNGRVVARGDRLFLICENGAEHNQDSEPKENA